jgi:hypothetical protein
LACAVVALPPAAEIGGVGVGGRGGGVAWDVGGEEIAGARGVDKLDATGVGGDGACGQGRRLRRSAGVDRGRREGFVESFFEGAGFGVEEGAGLRVAC